MFIAGALRVLVALLQRLMGVTVFGMPPAQSGI
jgi:hypothetical protein